MDTSPTHERRRRGASAEAPRVPETALAGALLGSAVSWDELDRMLLAAAVHPRGAGLEAARLFVWDEARERFQTRSAVRPAEGGALEDALRRARAGGPRHAGEGAAATVEVHALEEPAAAAWEHRIRVVDATGSGVRAAVTLMGRAGPYAVLLGSRAPGAHVVEAEIQLQRFSELAEWAIAEQERRAEERFRARLVTAAAELSRAVSSPGNIAEALHQAARLVSAACGARGSAVYLGAPGALRLQVTHGAPATRERLAEALLPVAAAVIAGGRRHVSECAAEEPLLSPDAAASIRAFAIQPLRAYERAVGAIAVYDPLRAHPADPRAFGAVELEALALLADLTAIAVDQAARFQEVREGEQRQRELSARLARQERLAALGEDAARIAEEARHPLASLRTFTRRAREALASGTPEREYLEIVLRETERIERLLGAQLDAAALEPPPSLRLQSLNDVVQGSLQRVGEALVRRRIRLLKKLAPDLPALLIDADRIGQMLGRVIENALESVTVGGRIRVETRRAAGLAVVEVAHDGTRSPGTALEHLFVPFAAGRPGSPSLGLGLAQRIVREHGGEIRVRADGEWSTVVIFTLPIPDHQDRRRVPRDRRQARGERRRKASQA